MSSITTSKLNTANSTTDLTLTTGNLSGPSIVITSNTNTGVYLTTNGTFVVAKANASLLMVNNSLEVANSLTVSGTGSFIANVTFTGSRVTFTSNVVAGSVNATSINATSFGLGTPSLGASGHTRLPNGLLMQWGTVTANTSAGTITWPTAFTSVYSVQLTSQSNVAVGQAVTGAGTSSANVRTANTTSYTFYYLALGE